MFPLSATIGGAKKYNTGNKPPTLRYSSIVKCSVNYRLNIQWGTAPPFSTIVQWRDLNLWSNQFSHVSTKTYLSHQRNCQTNHKKGSRCFRFLKHYLAIVICEGTGEFAVQSGILSAILVSLGGCAIGCHGSLVVLNIYPLESCRGEH